MTVTDCCICGAGAEAGGSGTSSKSINEVSVLSSTGFPLEDAKLLEDAVLCTIHKKLFSTLIIGKLGGSQKRKECTGKW